MNSFFYYLPSSGISSCVGTVDTECASTLGAALLCSSRVGLALGLVF